MDFIARLFRYLFWVLIVSWIFRLLSRVVNNMAMKGPETHPDVARPNDSVGRKLVRDPVCGMHMAETIAIPLRNGNELLHFCSMECRDKYVKGIQKLAANA
jgi:YHS domain-containing protein